MLRFHCSISLCLSMWTQQLFGEHKQLSTDGEIICFWMLSAKCCHLKSPFVALGNGCLFCFAHCSAVVKHWLGGGFMWPVWWVDLLWVLCCSAQWCGRWLMFRSTPNLASSQPTDDFGRKKTSLRDCDSFHGYVKLFELPVLAYFLGRLGVVTSQMLISGVRYAIVVIFILSAIMTPPDVLSQIMLAGPLWMLYEGALLYLKHTQKKAPPA